MSDPRPPIRQGGREMSAPRPYKTNTFRPPALFTLYAMISFYIYAKLFQSFLPWGNYIVSGNSVHLSFTHALFKNLFLEGSAPFQSHFVLYVARVGARYSKTLPLTLGRDVSYYGAADVRILRIHERNSVNLNIQWLLYHGTLDQTAKRKVLFKLSCNFLGRKGATPFSTVKLDFCSVIIYKATPNSTTGQTPAELIICRQLKARLRVKASNFGGKVFEELSNQKSRIDNGVPLFVLTTC